jgi:dTDP-4-amino-4,6-dideoxygalactose transaminase
MTEKLAIDGGTPLHTRPWPTWPVWSKREEELLLEVLHSGKWGTLNGTKVIEFEQKFAEFQGAKYGVAVTGGTPALELPLRALAIGPGDEVITSPYTFVATASAAIKVGATPIFADVEPGTLSLDAAAVEKAITPRTKAIMPVHIGGCPANMDAINAVAKRHNLPVIEDACQAWGAEWDGKRVGPIGQLGGFSFQASKNINAGEGGMIVTNDQELYERAWALHNVGRTPGKSHYEQDLMGYNYRMTEWQGAVLLAQLERLPEHIARREENAEYLSDLLEEIPGITPRTREPKVTQHAWHLYMFFYNADRFGGLPKTEFIRALQAEGVPCSPGYSPLYTSPAIRRALAELKGEVKPWQQGVKNLPEVAPCPVCEKSCQETVWLYQSQLLAEKPDMEEVAAAIRKIQLAKA